MGKKYLENRWLVTKNNSPKPNNHWIKKKNLRVRRNDLTSRELNIKLYKKQTKF